MMIKCSKEEKRVFFPQPIFTMSAQQNQLQNVTPAEFQEFIGNYKTDDVSPSTAKLFVYQERFIFFLFIFPERQSLCEDSLLEILKIKPTRKTCSKSRHFGSFFFHVARGS